MKRTLIVVAATAVTIASLTGCSSASSDAEQAWCGQAASTFKSWIPESAGGDAPMNDLPSNGDIQHAAIQLRADAPDVLRPLMNPVVTDALNGDATSLVSDASVVLNECKNSQG